jgi:putative hydrolase of the HAD superfamily
LSNADDGFLLPNLELLEVGFDTVLTSEQAQIYKPRLELFQLMLEQLGVTPEETVYVGDRQLEDVKGPSEAGMHPVWINRNKRPLDPDLPTPPHQISSLFELPKLLDNGLGS